jgi:hypothetical protein
MPRRPVDCCISEAIEKEVINDDFDELEQTLRDAWDGADNRNITQPI